MFRCDVRFEAPRIALVFDVALLDCANLADRSVAELVERRAEAALLELADARSFSTRVREQIMGSLGTESIGADLISRRLAVSRATLTRKLAQEGTTPSELLDDTRRDLAVEYLRNEGLSVEEVVRRLAFSDARAFRRVPAMDGLDPGGVSSEVVAVPVRPGGRAAPVLRVCALRAGRRASWSYVIDHREDSVRGPRVQRRSLGGRCSRSRG